MNEQPKSNRKGQYTIVLEDIRAKFEVFGEGLDHLSQKMDAAEQSLLNRMDRLELKVDIGFLELKNDSKIGHKQLENHENRIVTLENILLTKS